MWKYTSPRVQICVLWYVGKIYATTCWSIFGLQREDWRNGVIFIFKLEVLSYANVLHLANAYTYSFVQLWNNKFAPKGQNKNNERSNYKIVSCVREFINERWINYETVFHDDFSSSAWRSNKTTKLSRVFPACQRKSTKIKKRITMAQKQREKRGKIF